MLPREVIFEWTFEYTRHLPIKEEVRHGLVSMYKAQWHEQFCPFRGGQPQPHKDGGMGTVEGNEVQESGRGHTVLSLGNITKSLHLYLVRSRKLIDK